MKLEDGFGNAFAGKYDSVFCVNQGSPEQRLEVFEQAIRQVYASTMDPSALEYRRMRGLDKRDEQMAVLVQRVSGSHYGPYFMPCAAGVGYSHSAYRWMPDMDPAAGMLRIVMGLVTKAVDRARENYPRLVNSALATFSRREGCFLRCRRDKRKPPRNAATIQPGYARIEPPFFHLVMLQSFL